MKVVTLLIASAFLSGPHFVDTASGAGNRGSTPTEIKVNRLHDPLAVELRQPLFSWVMNSDMRADYQTAYRIVVSSTKDRARNSDGDLWDSRKVNSGEQSDIEYGGNPLESAKDYFWKVCVWNSKGSRSQWSEVARFGTGFFSWREWSGVFIGGRDYQLFRKEFSIDQGRKLASAKVFVGSLGVPVVYLNGRVAGNSVLNTADAVIKKTTWYRGHDVTEFIRTGPNAIGVMMGPGKLGEEYGSLDSLRFILNLVIRFEDGSTETIATDTTWRATKNGPLVKGELNNSNDGEKYDARHWPKGWNEAGFTADSWETGRSLSVSTNTQTLKAELTPPMKVMETRRPQYVTEVFPGIYVVDALANITGWAQIAVDGKPGDRIDMRFAEDVASLWNDYTYSVTANIVHGTAGLLFRVADENNHYCWQLTSGGKIVAQRNVKGKMEVIKEIPVNLSPGGEYKIKIKPTGNRIETWCENSLIDTLRDNAFSSGKVGFRVTKGDTARFRDLTLVHDATNKVLLESTGKSPYLWLNNVHVKSQSGDTALANQLEITNSDYVVSVFGNVNGGIDQSSLNVAAFIPDAMGTGAMQHDCYIHGGNGIETWEPFQTIHGFRYIEIKGYKGFDIDNIKIRTVRQAVDEDPTTTASFSPCPVIDEGKGNRGSFSTSNQMLKDLYKASILSTKSILQWGVPAGCTGRDERAGWTGEVASIAANYYTDMEAFYKQWLISMRETQHSDGYIDNLAPRQGERAPAFEEDVPWSSTGIIVMWDTYAATGDKSIIRDQYDAMKRFMDWCVATSNVSKSTTEYEDYTTNKDCWGDWGSELEKGWCCPERRPEGSLFATAFFYQSALRLSIMAKAIGKSADSKELGHLASKIRTAYNRKFLRQDTLGAYYMGNSQTANALSVALGLCPDEKTQKETVLHLVKDLENRNYTLTAGVLGLYAIFDALCDNGYADVAYRIATKKTYPSWGYWFKHGGYWLPGATSMWEFWDGHGFLNGVILGGKLNAFLVKNLGGISPLKPGYSQILIKPEVVGGLDDAKASVFSPRGRIEIDWIRSGSTSFEMKVGIPFNSTAEVHIPLLGNKPSDIVAVDGKTTLYREGAKRESESVKFLREQAGALVFRVGSGEYHFALRPL